MPHSSLDIYAHPFNDRYHKIQDHEDVLEEYHQEIELDSSTFLPFKFDFASGKPINPVNDAQTIGEIRMERFRHILGMDNHVIHIATKTAMAVLEESDDEFDDIDNKDVANAIPYFLPTLYDDGDSDTFGHTISRPSPYFVYDSSDDDSDDTLDDADFAIRAIEPYEIHDSFDFMDPGNVPRFRDDRLNGDSPRTPSPQTMMLYNSQPAEDAPTAHEAASPTSIVSSPSQVQIANVDATPAPHSKKRRGRSAKRRKNKRNNRDNRRTQSAPTGPDASQTKLS